MHSTMKFSASRPHFSRKYAKMLKESHSCNLLLEKYSLDQQTLEARLDLKARGSWRWGQVAFFDIRITHPNAPTSRNQTIEQIFHHDEHEEKKRQHND